MKYFGLILTWALGLVLGALSSVVTSTETDPTDDLSLSLRSTSRSEVYRVLHKHQMSEILIDRLDLFPKSQVPRLAQHIAYLCHYYGFDPAMVLSLIQVESRFRVKVVSPVGAVGLMQVMVPTAQFVIRELDFRLSGFENFRLRSLWKRTLTPKILMDPYVNTAVGIAYLAWLRDYYRGSSYHLLAAYNVGPARLDVLLARKSFEPVETKKYFQTIRRGVPDFRFYQKVQSPVGHRL